MDIAVIDCERLRSSKRVENAVQLDCLRLATAGTARM